MLPGDVYYYSANSLVLCVKQNPESDEGETDSVTVTRKSSAGLNPNASVFHSHKDASSWDSANVNEYQYTNGDVTPPEPGVGQYGVGQESPTQGPEGAPFVEGQMVYSPDSNTDCNEEGPVIPPDGTLDEEEMRNLLKNQLEICFSRDSLATDSYLQSQMDADQYVPIATIASLQQVTNLSKDIELITQLIRELPNVQVNDNGEKVRPIHNRCIVILREVPESYAEEVHQLFTGENCPKFVSCEFAGNDNWYVTFDSDADAQRAYQYLREDVVQFLGKPIMARIKAKPLIRMTYPRNGYRNRMLEQQQQQQQQQQQVPSVQPAQINHVQSPQMPSHSEPTQSPTQQHYPIQQQVPLMTNVQQYLSNQQTTSIPFFAPNPLLQQWTASPTVLDPSMVLAINGYQPTNINSHLKPNLPPRHQNHQYNNANRNSRNQRTSRPQNLDNRQGLDNRQSYDRMSNSHRTSPRMQDQQTSPSSYRNRGDGHYHNSQPPSAVTDNNSNNLPPRDRQSEAPPPAQRGYRSRRRKEEEGPLRNLRQNSTSSSTGVLRDKPALEPQFDLEINSFPPLPGPTPASSSSSNEVYENKLSDVVKGTAKQAPRENVKPTVTVTPMVTTPTITMASPAIQRPTSPPHKKENLSNNNPVNIVNGTQTCTSESSSSSCTPTRVPSPPTVSPQKPAKISVSSTEITPKMVEAHITPSKPVQHVTHMAKVQQVEKVPCSSPAKLSYAQMVQRGRDSDNGTESKQLSDSEQELVSPNSERPMLKEQSQTKTARGTAKEVDSPRKDAEPREQRHFNGRRAKENRERRDRRRSEREGMRTAAKT